MTVYTAMQLHLARHMYKRGKHKGTAPLDGSRRGRNHERVRETAVGNMAVRFHNTDVITVQPDDSFVVSCDGWFRSPTTRICLNDAFRKFFYPVPGLHVSVYNGVKYSKNQPIVSVNGKEYRYYDGITFSASGELLSTHKPFEAKRIDKSETKELHDGLKESGFKDVFKLLHAAATSDDVGWQNAGGRIAPQLRDILTNPDRSHNWPGIIRRYAFTHGFNWASRSYEYTKLPAGQAWTAIMKAAKEDLYETVIAK
jgi:hypothetical protein